MYFIDRWILKEFRSGCLEKHTNTWDAEEKFRYRYFEKNPTVLVFCNPVRYITTVKNPKEPKITDWTLLVKGSTRTKEGHL